MQTAPLGRRQPRHLPPGSCHYNRTLKPQQIMIRVPCQLSQTAVHNTEALTKIKTRARKNRSNRCDRKLRDARNQRHPPRGRPLLGLVSLVELWERKHLPAPAGTRLMAPVTCHDGGQMGFIRTNASPSGATRVTQRPGTSKIRGKRPLTNTRRCLSALFHECRRTEPRPDIYSRSPWEHRSVQHSRCTHVGGELRLSGFRVNHGCPWKRRMCSRKNDESDSVPTPI